LAFIQISDSEIAYPKFSKPDVLVVLSEQARERTKQFSIFNFSRQSTGSRISSGQFSIADFKDFLEKNKVPYQSYNIFFLSKLSKLLEEKGVEKKDVMFGLLEKKLGGKTNWEENKKAFELSN